METQMNTAVDVEKCENTGASWRDYLELCKPRVVLLMIITAIVGMCLATTHAVPLQILIFGTLGIAFAAGGAAVVNHVADERIDRKMARTKNRPIVQGKISPRNSIIFASVLAITAMTVLVMFVNTLTAVLTFASLIGYAGVYTLYLKHATPQNIVIGGIAGAAPPLLGWTAVTGQVSAQALLLVLIIFVWTPPHFWALAIYRLEDYVKANVPMLPKTHGVKYTKLNILLYTILLLCVSVLPFVIQMSGLIYLLTTLVIDLRFLYWVLKLFKTEDKKVALNTFKFSIYYLGILFVALLVDHYFYLNI